MAPPPVWSFIGLTLKKPVSAPTKLAPTAIPPESMPAGSMSNPQNGRGPVTGGAVAGPPGYPKTSSALVAMKEVFSWGCGKPFFRPLSIFGLGASLRRHPADEGGVAIWLWLLCCKGTVASVILELLAVRGFLVGLRPCWRLEWSRGCGALGVAFGSFSPGASPSSDGEGSRAAQAADVKSAAGLHWYSWAAVSKASSSPEHGRFLTVDVAAGLAGADSRPSTSVRVNELARKLPGVELKTEKSSANRGVQPEASSQ